MLSGGDFAAMFAATEAVASNVRDGTGRPGIGGGPALFHTGLTSIDELIGRASTLEARREVVRAVVRGLPAHSNQQPVSDYEVQVMTARARTMMLRERLDALRAQTARREQELAALREQASSDVGAAGARARAELGAAGAMVSALEDRVQSAEAALRSAWRVRVFLELVVRECERFPAQDAVYMEQASRALRVVRAETRRMRAEEEALRQEAEELRVRTLRDVREETERAAAQRAKLLERLQRQRERQVELVRRGVQRERRRLEIANQAAGDLGEAEEEQLRRGVEEAEARVARDRQALEDRREVLGRYTKLFERIKETTGVNEAAELIQRHRQRTEIRHGLKSRLSSYEARLRELRRETEAAEEERRGLEAKAAEVTTRRLRELEEAASREASRVRVSRQKLRFARGVLADMRAGATHMCTMLGVTPAEMRATAEAGKADEAPPSPSASSVGSRAESKTVFAQADSKIGDEDVPALMALAEQAALKQLERLAAEADEETIRAAEALGLAKAAGFARLARGGVHVIETAVTAPPASSGTGARSRRAGAGGGDGDDGDDYDADYSDEYDDDATAGGAGAGGRGPEGGGDPAPAGDGADSEYDDDFGATRLTEGSGVEGGGSVPSGFGPVGPGFAGGPEQSPMRPSPVSSLAATRAAARILGLGLTDDGHLDGGELHHPSAQASVHVPADLSRYRDEVARQSKMRALGRVTGLATTQQGEEDSEGSSDTEGGGAAHFSELSLALTKAPARHIPHAATTPSSRRSHRGPAGLGAAARAARASGAPTAASPSASGLRRSAGRSSGKRSGRQRVAPLPTSSLRRAPDSRRDPQVQALLGSMLRGDAEVERATREASQARREAKAGRAAAAAASVTVSRTAVRKATDASAATAGSGAGRGARPAPKGRPQHALATDEVVRDLLVARGVEERAAEAAVTDGGAEAAGGAASASAGHAGSGLGPPKAARRVGRHGRDLDALDEEDDGSPAHERRSRRRPQGEGQALASASLFASTGLLGYASVPSVRAVLSADEEVVDRRALKEVSRGVRRAVMAREARAKAERDNE